MIRNVIFSFILTITVCCSKDNRSSIIMGNSEEGRRLRRERDSVYYEEEKKRFPSSTFDLLQINSDTLLASTRYNGIISTMDGGQTWTSISSPGTISKLTIDDQKQIWGLHSWRGIHEPDRSVLYSSNDFGQTWKKHELNTEEIFPADFHSEPGGKLNVIDYDSKIYKLINENPELNWQRVDSLNDKLGLNPWVRGEFLIDKTKRRWTFDEHGIFLVDKDTTKMY